jgi:hypothetical protein
MPHDPFDSSARLPEPPAGDVRPPFDDLTPPNQRHPLDGRRREWMLVARHPGDDPPGARANA